MRYQLPYYITRPLITSLCAGLIFQSAASELPFAVLPPGHPMPDGPHQDHSPGPPIRLAIQASSTTSSISVGGITR
jgi:hypothetical protein